jgi:hypothetical protein
VARGIFAGLRATVGQRVESALDADEAGAVVVDRAVLAGLRSLLGDESVAPGTLAKVM